MPRLYDDINGINKAIFSSYGGYPALIFEGDELFINRCHALTINFGIAKPDNFHHLNDNKYYILAPEARIKKGLKNAFAAEISFYGGKEIDKTKKIEETENSFKITVDFNELIVEALAEQAMEDFWNDKVEKNNYMAISMDQPTIGEYGVGGHLNDEPERITE